MDLIEESGEETQEITKNSNLLLTSSNFVSYLCVFKAAF